MNPETDLSTDLLFAFITVAENGGIVRAAERLHRTQSAISMKMQRLEERLGLPLFELKGRTKVLTPAGETMLIYARKLLDLQSEAISTLKGSSFEGELRVGMSHALAESDLAIDLAAFAHQYSSIQLTVTSHSGRALRAGFDQSEFDYIIYVQEAVEQQENLLRTHRLTWHCAEDFKWEPGQVMPLAGFADPCVFREISHTVLRRADIPWRDVYITNSLSALMKAVEVGLGVTIRTPGVARGKTRFIGPETGLPALPEIQVVCQYQKASPLALLFAEWLQNRPPHAA
jgi:DNA-binding transcriptional LysR family regulator